MPDDEPPLGEMRCLDCQEPILDRARVYRTATITAAGTTVRAYAHTECAALNVIGHQFGVCSCTGFDHSRASALELGRRMEERRDTES